MDRKPVKSSNIASIGYHPATKTLEIEFKNGSVFQYNNIEQSHHAALMTADSPGGHFAKHIRVHAKKFPARKVNQ